MIARVILPQGMSGLRGMKALNLPRVSVSCVYSMGVGGTIYKKIGTFVRKFEFKNRLRSSFVSLKLYLTCKRYHLKRNTLDCQSLFRIGPLARRLDL